MITLRKWPGQLIAWLGLRGREGMFAVCSTRLDIRLTVLGAFVALVAGCLFYTELLSAVGHQISTGDYRQAVTTILLGLSFLMLFWANLIYFAVRAGWLNRNASHVPLNPEQLWRLYDKNLSSLTVLIPSYKEDHAVVSRALISAALMQYPQKNVVLLVDDAPFPNS